MSVILKVEVRGKEEEVELKLTRSSVLAAERRGILNMASIEAAPIAFFYSLAYAAVLSSKPSVSQKDVDDAVNTFLDEGGVLADLTEALMGQYEELFGTADEVDII